MNIGTNIHPIRVAPPGAASLSTRCKWRPPRLTYQGVTADTSRAPGPRSRFYQNPIFQYLSADSAAIIRRRYITCLSRRRHPRPSHLYRLLYDSQFRPRSHCRRAVTYTAACRDIAYSHSKREHSSTITSFVIP